MIQRCASLLFSVTTIHDGKYKHKERILGRLSNTLTQSIDQLEGDLNSP